MGLIVPQTVETKASCCAKYYEDLGYEIPKHYSKIHNCYFRDRDATIKVSVLDLKPNSNHIVKVKCDKCGREEEITMMEYTRLKAFITKYGYDYLCLDCKFDVSPTAKLNVGTFRNNDEVIKSFLIRKLKAYVEKNGYPTSKRNAFKPKNNMPSLRMYNENLGGDLVDWLELCGYALSEDEKYQMRKRGKPNTISKEKCISIIMSMQAKLDRPLEYKDFNNPDKDSIGVTNIKHYWGSLNKMKAELGLEVTKENMSDKQLSLSGFDKQIDDILLFLKENNRNFTTSREINEGGRWASYGTLSKMCQKYYHIKLVDHLLDKGIFLGKQGQGLNYNFNDGEHTTSFYEYLFSKFLKENGYIYGKTYFRDVKYNTFISNYKGNMNCDYVIHTNKGVLYIEIAGIIEYYKTWYYQDKPITQSKSKEKYRIKLKEKESMLKNDGLNYFILFPCDLTEDNFNEILTNPSIELRKRIENFYKNNIEWSAIRNMGNLKYNYSVLGKDNMPSVIYE